LPPPSDTKKEQQEIVERFKCEMRNNIKQSVSSSNEFTFGNPTTGINLTETLTATSQSSNSSLGDSQNSQYSINTSSTVITLSSNHIQTTNRNTSVAATLSIDTSNSYTSQKVYGS